MTYEPSRRQPSFTPRTPQSQAPYGQAQPHDWQAQYRDPSPPPQQRVSANRPAAPRRRRQRGRRLRMVLWAIICSAVVIIAVTVLASSGGGAKYSARVISYTAVNPADLSVAVRVTNTGSKSGTPTCTINAQDPSYTYTGVDIATLQGSVASGASTTFVDNLTITEQGAKYVTQVTVSC